jgi:hypothetical protein
MRHALLLCCLLALGAAEPMRVDLAAAAAEILAGGESRSDGGVACVRRTGAGPLRLAWTFIAPAAGRAALWLRESSRHNSAMLRVRLDDGAWIPVRAGIGLSEIPVTSAGQPGAPALGWSRACVLDVTAGQRRLDIETTDERGWTLERIVLTDGPFDPQAETIAILAQRGITPANLAGAPRADAFAVPWGRAGSGPSSLDILAALPGPVTERDRVVRSGDGFARADGRPLRLFGGSVPFTPEPPDATAFAEQARRLGVNHVRFHGPDSELIDELSERNFVLEPGRLDRFHWFVAELKRCGIHIWLDPLYHWWRKWKPDPAHPEIEQIAPRGTIPFFYDPALQELHRAWLRTLLTARNPYTGTTLAEDPVLALLTVTNENSLFFYAADNLPPRFDRMRQALWNAHLAQRHATRAELAARWGEALREDEDPAQGTVRLVRIHDLIGAAKPGSSLARRAEDQVRWMDGVQDAYFQGIRRFIHDELRCPALVNGSGWKGVDWLDRIDLAVNARLDFVELHGYFDHPQGGWGHDAVHHNQRFLARLAGSEVRSQDVNEVGPLVGWFARKHAAGVPLVIGEWNVCMPNDFVLDAIPVMATYGALHGWDGLTQYRLDHLLPSPLPSTYFLSGGEHIALMPMGAVAFAQQAISTTPTVARAVCPPEALHVPAPTPSLPGTAILQGRCEIDFAAGAQALTPPPAAGVLTAADGAVRWDGDAPWMRVQTPRLAGVLGRPGTDPLTLAPGLDVRLAPGTDAAVFLLPLAGAANADATRLLLTIAGPSQPANGYHRQPTPLPKSKSGDMGFRLRQAPRGSWLMRGPVGELRSTVPLRAAWALDLEGRRRESIPLSDGGRALAFSPALRTWWIEIER